MLESLPGAVLFACTMNAIRSPMAEGIMKRHHGTRVFVDSVGVRKGELDPFVVAVMDEVGIDLSQHRPRPSMTWKTAVSTSSSLYHPKRSTRRWR